MNYYFAKSRLIFIQPAQMTGTEPDTLSKNGLQTANTPLFIHIINELVFLFWARGKAVDCCFTAFFIPHPLFIYRFPPLTPGVFGTQKLLS
jgi:hypothetical protein